MYYLESEKSSIFQSNHIKELQKINDFFCSVKFLILLKSSSSIYNIYTVALIKWCNKNIMHSWVCKNQGLICLGYKNVKVYNSHGVFEYLI